MKSTSGQILQIEITLQRSTEHVNFWQQAPPIWATATEQGLQISTYLWSRCDISWQDTKPISPAYCETVFQKDGSKTMRINMERALIDFQHGFDATIVSFLDEIHQSYFCKK
jgi:hypothetical protein